MSSNRDYSAIGWAYAQAVADGTIPAGKLARAACKRSLADRERQGSEAFPYIFSDEAAARVCGFIEQCEHTQGDIAGKPFVLEAWQCFVLSQMCGWLHDRGERQGLRRFRYAYLEVPRGSGKSMLSSALGLYFLTADGVTGARVFCAATTSKQAKIVWKESKVMAQALRAKSPSFRAKVKCLANAIETNGNGYFVPLSRDKKGAEGNGIAAAIIDELHLHETDELYSAITLGAGRKVFPNSMVLIITTAGDNIAGICYQKHQYTAAVLDEDEAIRHSDDAWFGMVYSCDDGDDWKEESTWRKANPNYGISVDESDFRNQFAQAMVSIDAQHQFMTKKLCVWIDSVSQYFDMVAAKECGSEKLDPADFAGERAYLGLDMSSSSDLTCKATMIKREIDGKQHWYCFAQFYLPEATIKNSGNARYRDWANKGYIKLTAGEALDDEAVQADVLADLETFDVQEVAFDPWEARSLIARLMNNGVEAVKVPQTIANLSEPTKLLDKLIRTRRFHFNNPVLYWCAANTVVYVDGNGNVKPIKDADLSRKNDGIMAVITALARGMLDDPEAGVSMYENGELVII